MVSLTWAGRQAKRRKCLVLFRFYRVLSFILYFLSAWQLFASWVGSKSSLKWLRVSVDRLKSTNLVLTYWLSIHKNLLNVFHSLCLFICYGELLTARFSHFYILLDFELMFQRPQNLWNVIFAPFFHVGIITSLASYVWSFGRAMYAREAYMRNSARTHVSFRVHTESDVANMSNLDTLSLITPRRSQAVIARLISLWSVLRWAK